MLLLALFVSVTSVARPFHAGGGVDMHRRISERPSRQSDTAARQAALQEVVVEIRVHGNVATPDQEVAQLAGIQVGASVGASTIADTAARLRATKKFQQVDVLKRFASITDPTQVIVVIIVDEGSVKIEKTGNPASPTRVVRTRGPHLMFLPLLTSEDGYGPSYGAQFALPDPAGKDSRLSFPATWGGNKRAGVEFEKAIGRSPLSRVTAEASVSRRTHPFFEQDEDRGRVSVRAEREIVHTVRVGADTGWQHVSFLGAHDSFIEAGADVVLDTRLDPMLARNAVYARAAWTHVDVKDRDGFNRSELEGRGYVGLFGQSVLVVRALRDDADRPRPAYLQPMLGGLANLRGFNAGSAVGDTLVAASTELRLPLTSPLSVGKIGVNAFVDAGTVYAKGERLSDQVFKRGVGAGLWFTATFVRLNMVVAHGIGATTRVHFGGSLSF